MKSLQRLVFALLYALAIPVISQAGVAPDLVNYQAIVTDTEDQPLEGQYNVSFAIYGSIDGSDVLWREDHGLIDLSGGHLSVTLGSGSPAVPLTGDVFSTKETFIEITIDGQPLSPRTRLLSVPYSERVGTIDLADGGKISGSVHIMPPTSKSGDAYETSLIVTGEAADSVIISPAEDIGLKATNDNGDEVFAVKAATTGGTIRITASDAAKDPMAAGREIVIDPAEEIVISAVEPTGDSLVMITAGASTGGKIRITASDAAKNPMSAGRTVTIDPAEEIVLNAVEPGGDTLVMITANAITGGAMRITASDAAKAADSLFGSVLINSDGMFILGQTPNDTVLQLLPDGNIVSDGQIRTGSNSSNAGEWATALGYDAQASGDTSVVSGGASNIADSVLASVGGGAHNAASGFAATVGGGASNLAAASYATIAGGQGHVAAGQHSSILGGVDCAAIGEISTSFGNRGKANHAGSIVISANSSTEPDDSIQTGGEEQVVIRADGGLYLTSNGGLADYNPDWLINTPSGAHMSRSGHWNNSSDVNRKENFQTVDGRALLDKLASLSVMQWNYKSEDDTIVHIGPTAQDFYSVFGVGSDDKTISTIDPSGIALAAIQELDRRTRQYEAQTEKIDQLLELIAKMQAEIDQMREDR